MKDYPSGKIEIVTKVQKTSSNRCKNPKIKKYVSLSLKIRKCN